MITNFKLKNYRSFKNEVNVNVEKTNYKILTETNLNGNVLKGLFFYGPNASGKTNILRGLRLLLQLLFAEKIINLSSERCLFSSDKNITLEYDFLIEQHQIKYYIEYNIKQKGYIEKLFIDDNLKLNRLYDTGESYITENKLFTEIDPNSLLLREIYFNTKFRGHDILKKWFDYLLNSVFLDDYKRTIFNPGKQKLLLEDYLNDNGVDDINTFFNNYNFDQLVEYAKESVGNQIKIETSEEYVFFKRKGINEPIPYILESLGNQNLLHLLPSFFHVIKNGGMLIIDEFSSGFHNFLEELLIKYFMTNSLNSQIFVVSHSTNLLKTSLIRPDQVYSVDFIPEEGSFIERFSNEKPREGQNLEKMYKSGIFGGLPKYEN